MLIRLPLLFIAALLINGASAQSAPTSPSSFKRVYVGVSTTQGVGYRYLIRNKSVPAPDDDESIPKDVIQIRNKQDKPDYAFDAGIRLGVNVTRFFAIETGVDYSRITYTNKWQNLYFGSQWDGTGYGTPIISDWKAKTTYRYQYLNIPLSFNFHFGKGKVQTAINAGGSFNYLLASSTKTHINGSGINNSGVSDNTNQYSTFNFSPFLGIGINYQITPLIALRAMPTFQIQALKNVKDAPLTEYLYSGGINVALTFGFIDANAKGSNKAKKDTSASN
jgi:hypothetical protein